jgi:hypothetical protein
MSTLSMTSSAVRGVREEIFSKKTNFNIFLRTTEDLVVMKSKGTDEYGPVHYLRDLTTGMVVFIAKKLKPIVDKNVEGFIELVEKNAKDYEIGLSIPSEKYPEANWILYKKGEGGEIVGRFTTSADDQKVATVKP